MKSTLQSFINDKSDVEDNNHKIRYDNIIKEVIDKYDAF